MGYSKRLGMRKSTENIKTQLGVRKCGHCESNTIAALLTFSLKSKIGSLI